MFINIKAINELFTINFKRFDFNFEKLYYNFDIALIKCLLINFKTNDYQDYFKESFIMDIIMTQFKDILTIKFTNFIPIIMNKDAFMQNITIKIYHHYIDSMVLQIYLADFNLYLIHFINKINQFS